MAVGDFRTPGVYVQEVRGQPRITPASTGIAGFVGFTERGPIDKAVLIGSFTDFEDKYGGFYLGNYMPYALRGFFDQGGNRAYIARCVGTGNATAELSIRALEGGPAVAGTVLSGNAGPYTFAVSGVTVVVSVDGAPTVFATFSGTKASRTGVGGVFLSAFTGGETLEIAIDGGATQEITFAAADDSSAANIAAVINAQLVGGFADVSGGQVRITSDIAGTSSEVEVVGGSAATTLGLAVGSSVGTGTVANLANVSAAEAASVIDAAVPGLTAVADGNFVRLTSDTTGVSSSVQVTVATTATEFGFDNLVHSGAASSVVNGLKVKAHNPGAWGNRLQVTTTRWAHELAAGLSNGATSVVLDSVRDVQVGDIVVFGDASANHAIAHINAINPTTKTISFQAISGLTAPLVAGADVKSSSTHRKVTTSSAAVLSTATSIPVVDANGFRPGAVIIVDDTTNIESYIVQQVSGNTLIFASALGTAFSSGAIVSSQEFYLQITEDGIAGTPVQYLSLESTNKFDYAELQYGFDNSTYQFELEDLGASAAFEAYRLPIPIENQPLTGGLDGAVLTDSDFIGTTSPARGMQLLKSANELNFFCVPGNTEAAVLQEAIAIAEALQTVEVIAAAPFGMNDVDDLVAHKNFTLLIDSTHFALYHPWLKERDDDNPNIIVDVPPEGKIAGAWAAISNARGFHIAPANIALVNVLGLSHDVTDAEQDILNPSNINVIRLRLGRGIRIWGARTLTSETDGRELIPVRRTMSFIERSVKNVLEGFVFSPINGSTYSQISQLVGNFMHGLFLSGVFGSSQESRAYFVKCDGENNPQSVRDLRQIICDIGFQPLGVAEFIIVRVGTTQDSTSISEEIARRG